jgi:hypothetical protein
MSSGYLLFTDQQYGPYDLETLKTCIQQGELAPETWVYCEGETAAWTRADEVGTLKGFFKKSPTSAPSPPNIPSSVKNLGDRVKQSLKTDQDEGDNFGTMLVAPGKGKNLKAAVNNLQQAPNSDIVPTDGVETKTETKPVSKGGVFAKLLGMFRKSKVPSESKL